MKVGFKALKVCELVWVKKRFLAFEPSLKVVYKHVYSSKAQNELVYKGGVRK